MGGFSETRLLRYLMPYGDAVFNQAQAPDLLDDLRHIVNSARGTVLSDLAVSIEPLAERLASDVHVYLWFIGN